MTPDGTWIGRRLTVRHRVPGVGPSGGPALTDVVGRLREVGADHLLLERRDGSHARVPRADVVAARVVPDRPRRPRRATAVTAEDLTRISSRGWPAPESVPLGEWELRAAGAFTGRANSVAVHGDPGLPLAEALAAVVDFYAVRGLRPQAQVIEGSAWEQPFLDAGWRPGSGTHPGAVVRVADLADPPDSDERVVMEATASDDWLSLYGRVDDVEAARRVLEGPATVAFARIDDDPAGIARVVVTGEWAGIAAVEVSPDHRRRGLAAALVRTCLAWAVEQGADKAYLQTMRDNTAALALYEPFGFVDHHDYRYLEPGDSSGTATT